MISSSQKLKIFPERKQTAAPFLLLRAALMAVRVPVPMPACPPCALVPLPGARTAWSPWQHPAGLGVNPDPNIVSQPWAAQPNINGHQNTSVTLGNLPVVFLQLLFLFSTLFTLDRGKDQAGLMSLHAGPPLLLLSTP